jgi:5-methylcytosine-specific restriction endonuclease McrA
MQPRILTLNNAGQPVQWCTWQDAVTHKYKGVIAWSLGEQEFEYKGGNSRLTGERSVITIPSIIAVKNQFKVKSRVPMLTNRNLFRRDINLCAYCGSKHNDSELTRDHIVATSRGGLDTWTNCVTACFSCNNRKDNKSLKEARMELLYVPYVPDKAEALILQNRNILADQMEFLLAYIPKASRVHQYLQ